jgi:uncharacterized protein YcbX
MASNTLVGSVVSIYRYPVKSMQGEELNLTEVTSRGLAGDRAYALVDSSDGKVASAKNPNKWFNLFDFRASYTESPHAGKDVPSAHIVFPDGSDAVTGRPDLDRLLSSAIGRAVNLRASAPEKALLEEYWPDIEGLPHRDHVTDESLPAGTFFDCAVVHVLTTTTIDSLRLAYPQGRFEVRRFRPNVVVALSDTANGFPENEWVGKEIQFGNEVRLRITMPCGRCVMTTLAQSDLPKDTGILRTSVQHNKGGVGVYASVVRGGKVRRGDPVSFG